MYLTNAKLSLSSGSNDSFGGGPPCVSEVSTQPPLGGNVTYPCTLPWVWRQQWRRNATCIDELGATGVIQHVSHVITLERSNLAATGMYPPPHMTCIGSHRQCVPNMYLTCTSCVPNERETLSFVCAIGSPCVSSSTSTGGRDVSMYLMGT